MARSVDLNKASMDELSRIRMVGKLRAQRIIDFRPYKSWDDVAKIPGFSSGMLSGLRKSGVQVGRR